MTTPTSPPDPPAATDAKAAGDTFDTGPEHYRHWRLTFDGPVATLSLDVDENATFAPGYTLKLNSYDLGVDIELADALLRIRFEHPEVGAVILTSARERVFCSGANIFMLGQATHAAKVNFCRFTNETRNHIEDASAHSGIRFIAACNGATAGGGYELALACDEIWLVDDRSSAVSLPEVPLLGVLPGTGGLTRLTDKRRVRRDLADVFCTLVEGVRAPRALAWRLIDRSAKPQQFSEQVGQRARELAVASDRPDGTPAVALPPLDRTCDAHGYHYRHVDVRFDRPARCATIAISGPSRDTPHTIEGIVAAGASWWPLAMARELDNAILLLRHDETELGTWVLRTRGDIASMLAVDAALDLHRAHGLVRETIGLLRRTFARLEVSSRSLFALVEPASCFAGTLQELALAADRTYMLAADATVAAPPKIALSTQNFGAYPTIAGRSRIAARFHGDPEAIGRAHEAVGRALDAAAADALGLVTATPDALDWDEEIRIALEERASVSPDALTAMEANLRFDGCETAQTRIFGRLSAWQNWVFSRPNAIGEAGALRIFGSGRKPRFDRERT